MTTPNLKEIEWAISELENSETKEDRYVLLAALYICRDQMRAAEAQTNQIGAEKLASAYIPAPQMRQDHPEPYGDSDFLRAVSQNDPENAWGIMDELMKTLHVVEPRVYNRIMRKLGA